MRVIEILVLCLFVLQVQGKPEEDKNKLQITTTARTALALSNRPAAIVGRNEYPPFFDNCDKLFKNKHFDAIIIKEMSDAITSHLETVCDMDEKLSQIPTIFIGNMFCTGNLPQTTDVLLNYILDKEKRACIKIKSFRSVYISDD